MDQAGGEAPPQSAIRPRTKQRRIGYELVGERIGAGAYGNVYRAKDTDTGVMMAVKVVYIQGAKERRRLRNEVDILARSRHDHIVEFITTDGWSESEISIFMGLKDGTLASLALKSSSSSVRKFYKTVLHHMLKALDYLATQGIVHRDIKPDNVLYSTVQGRYHFQLADFGMATKTGTGSGRYGARAFRAPEVILGEIHTTKVDVWSLYITILWALDDEGFREKCVEMEHQIQRHAVPERLYHDIAVLVWPIPTRFRNMQEMVAFFPGDRASAGYMLQKLFQGRGRTPPDVNTRRQD